MATLAVAFSLEQLMTNTPYVAAAVAIADAAADITAITHAFTLDHTDSESGVRRQLAVMIDDQGNTHFSFTTTSPGEEPLKTELSLGDISMDMLGFALYELNHNIEKHARDSLTTH